MQKSVIAGLVIFSVGVLFACSSGKIPLIPKIDTPGYHIRTGEKMLEFNKIESAFREFNRAIDLDPKYSPAYIGLGLTHAFRDEFEKGLEALSKADRYARGKEQEIAAYVGYMRFYLIGAERFRPDWLNRVEDAFSKAILIADELPAPYYYMGMAYKAAGKFDLAAKKFYRVLELGKKYVKEAEQEYAAIENRK